jgi:hypothetical protein
MRIMNTDKENTDKENTDKEDLNDWIKGQLGFGT